MPASTIKIIFALFLLAHGFIHASLSWVPVPKPGAMQSPFLPSWTRKDVSPTWPISRLGLSESSVRTIGWILWLLVTVLFVLAGLGLFGVPGLAALWQTLATLGAILSLVLVALYWHPWYPAAPILDLLILAVITFKFPHALFE
jgi:hypothetical protein